MGNQSSTLASFTLDSRTIKTRGLLDPAVVHSNRQGERKYSLSLHLMHLAKKYSIIACERKREEGKLETAT